jgi:ribosomal protein L37AE/L43A
LVFWVKNGVLGEKTGVKMSGGAYEPETPTAKTAKYGIQRLRANQQN